MKLVRMLLGVAVASAFVVGFSAGNAVAAESEKSISFTGTLVVTNPCTGELLTATGTSRLTIEVSRSGRVEVTEKFRGRAGAYRVELEGKARSEVTAGVYLLNNVRSEWEGPTEFTTRGRSLVFATVDGLTPTGD
jgi:hypothetical protein